MQETWATRACAAAILIGAALLYWALFTPESYPLHYWACAGFDGALVMLFPRLLGENALAHDLQRINFASILNHLGGWALYEMYFPPDIYNWVLLLLTGLEWLRLLTVRNVDKSPKNCWRIDLVRNRPRGGSKRFARTENL
jgi:hypothetical protein